MLNLIAVDPGETVVREDGFRLEISPEDGVRKRLTIACLLPVDDFRYRTDDFVRNMYRVRGETKHPLFDRSKIKLANLGLHESFPKEVLAAIYEIRHDGVLYEKLTIDTATVEGLSFKTFMALDDFRDAKRLIEDFIRYDASAWDRYTSKESNAFWDEDTQAHRLVATMQSLFNKTCSVYAHKKMIKTVKKQDVDISFGVHAGVLHFNAPVRKAEGLVNLTNLTDHLKGNPLTFTAERLKSFGIELQERHA